MIRLLPLVILSISAVLALKVVAFLGNEGEKLSAFTTAYAQEADAEPNNADEKMDDADADKEEPAEEPEMTKEEKMTTPPGPTRLLGQDKKTTRERILERVGERSDSLDKRERAITLREQLLAAAEKRLDSKIKKLENLNGEGEGAVQKAAEKRKQGLKDLIVMYETMKPKEAARILNGLSMEVLHSVATAMNPRKMSAILAAMDVKAAERLTNEIAARAIMPTMVKKTRQLPKIGG